MMGGAHQCRKCFEAYIGCVVGLCPRCEFKEQEKKWAIEEAERIVREKKSKIKSWSHRLDV